jgi:predicted Zn-dependent peptidase
LLNFVQNPYITDKSVENEKGIIGQEIRMYQDDPDWQVYFNFINCLYNNFSVKKDIAGTIESIAGIDKELLYKCFNTFYDPSNMVIFVVGDVDADEVFKMVEDSINVNKNRLNIETIYPKEEPKINIDFKEVKCDVALPLFMFGFKIDNNHEDIIKDEIATNIALEVIAGKSSSLFEKLYEDELITSPMSIDVTFEKGYSFCAVGGESKDPDAAVERIKEEIENLKNSEIPVEVFERVKKRLIGDFIRQFNSVEKIAHMFMSNIFREVDIFEYIDKYNEIDKEYVENIVKEYFNIELSAVSVVKPQ